MFAVFGTFVPGASPGICLTGRRLITAFIFFFAAGFGSAFFIGFIIKKNLGLKVGAGLPNKEYKKKS